MLRERFNQCSPAGVVLRRRDILFVPKRVQVIGGRELLGHEAQLDKRAHVVLKQAIVNLVNVRKVVNRMAGGVLVVQADFVVENRVETNVIEIGDGLHLAQIVTVTFAQREYGAARAEHLLPEMREGMRGSLRVNLDYLGRLRILRGGRGAMQTQKQPTSQR